MKKILFALAMTPLTALAVTAFDVARVTSVTPQVEQMRTAGQCRTVYTTEQRNTPANNGVGGSILGGVVGGLLGNTVGGGTGRTVATAAGAIAGAMVGGNMGRNDSNTRSETYSHQVCDADNFSSVTTGYLVEYDYMGQRGTTVLQSRPSSTIEMRVSAEPR